eukprot:TRINITY_DN4873_c0_g1_i1.p1 TRINITY_DN4873_c0_g1~~TRINITY_DN4873_c0_g1_i1.p1  ORF type:complete len:313 (-),score=59.26 TRINITY_DN4873_c0_g1_i1:194-1132(-)
MEQLIELLKNTPIQSEDFETLSNIITVNTDTPVVQAIEKLNTYNISSVPVLTSDGKLAGIVDTFDIIGFALEIFPSEADLEEDFFRSFLHSNFELETRKSSDILNKNYTDSMFTMNVEDSIYKIVEILGNGIHRLPILDQSRTHLVNIVSQTNLIRFLLKNIHLAPKLRDATLDQLGMAEKELLTSADSARVVDVLKLLLGTKFSAILCYDKNQLPSISLSANDVRNLEKDSFASMFFSVRAYYQQYAPKNGRKLICCRKSTRFAEVLELLVEHKIHRLWIQNDHDDKIVGLVTMTDILQRILLPLPHHLNE